MNHLPIKTVLLVWFATLALLVSAGLGYVAACDEFTIFGKISDRDDQTLLLFGQAVPVDQKGWSSEGAHAGGRQSWVNIQIHSADQSLITPGNGYYQNGVHCYLHKQYGYNSFGARVPVWIYGPPMDRAQRTAKLAEEVERGEILSSAAYKDSERRWSQECPNATGKYFSIVHDKTDAPEALAQLVDRDYWSKSCGEGGTFKPTAKDDAWRRHYVGHLQSSLALQKKRESKAKCLEQEVAERQEIQLQRDRIYRSNGKTLLIPHGMKWCPPGYVCEEERGRTRCTR